MKNKLSLSELKVSSFTTDITTKSQQTVQGGAALQQGEANDVEGRTTPVVAYVGLAYIGYNFGYGLADGWHEKD